MANNNLFIPSSSLFIPNQQFYNPYGESGQQEGYDDSTTQEVEGDWFELRGVREDVQNSAQMIPMTAVSFDHFEELIWVGLGNGRLISYFSSSLEKYSSVISQHTEIRHIETTQEGIISLGGTQLKFHGRGGIVKLSQNFGPLADLNSLSFFDPDSSSILLGGSSFLYIYDLSRGHVVKEISTREPAIQVDGTGRLITIGHASGAVTLRDPLTFLPQTVLPAHEGGLTNLLMVNDLLLTSGFSNSVMAPEWSIKIFDLRSYASPLATIPFPQGPQFLKSVLSSPSEVVVVSQLGHVQFLNISDPSQPVPSTPLYNMNVEGLTVFDLSPSGEQMVFGDVTGFLSQWSEKEDPKVNEFSMGTVVPIDLAPPPPTISMNEHSPLGMMTLSDWIPSTSLLSYWNPHLSFPTPLPREMDTSLLPDYKQVDFVGYAKNPGIRRNQMPNRKSRQRRIDLVLQKAKKVRPPPSYRFIEMENTKWGFDAFNFAPFNSSPFSGLENILPNSYCNVSLHTFYFLPELRRAMLSHICEKDVLRLTNVDMLDTARGVTCQASNFLRSFRQIPQASGLGLTDPPRGEREALPRLMETFNRFIFEQLHQEGSDGVIEHLFGAEVKGHSKCLSCKHVSTRSTRSFQFDLVFPETSSPQDQFVDILKSSLSRESHTKAWCDECGRYQLTEQKKSLQSLPPILSLNSPVLKAHSPFTGRSLEPGGESWLPTTLRISSQGDKLTVEVPTSPNSSSESSSDIYELWAVISHVEDPSPKASRPSHLVAQLRVDPSYHSIHSKPPTVPSSSKVPHLSKQARSITVGDTNPPERKEGEGEWYLFNDFHVKAIPLSEVLDFSFKTPCVIFYRKAVPAPPPPPPLPLSDYFYENPIKKPTKGANSRLSRTFLPLSPHSNYFESPGVLVAIDAEFVSLGAEETELRADGSVVVVNPCHFSLARVSVLRGEGDLIGEPFIDDYIVTREPVVDYLTRYSGIVPGDLDPKVSKHHLTTLKAAYLKLRYLIDRGCLFVGHGLAKDFRIINVMVPPEQIIDTVELFHLEGRRKISLRFLASCLLRLDIQSETHCSIEDARTALSLYQKYLQLVQEGRFEETLLQIYELGRQTKWAIPEPNA